MTTQIRTASITVSRAALYQQLTEAKRIVDPKITAPILRTVLLTIANGALSVAATDMRLNVLGQVAATSQTGEIGLSCGIDAKKLHDVVKALPGDVTLEIVERSGTEKREGGGMVRWCKVCDGQVALHPGYQPKFCPKKGCTASALVDFKMVSSFDVTSTLSSGKSRFNLLSLRVGAVGGDSAVLVQMRAVARRVLFRHRQRISIAPRSAATGASLATHQSLLPGFPPSGRGAIRRSGSDDHSWFHRQPCALRKEQNAGARTRQPRWPKRSRVLSV